MKKKLCLVYTLLLLTMVAFCETKNQAEKSGLELSCYLSQRNSVTSLQHLTGGNLSGALSIEYTLPIVPNLGFSGRVEVGGSYIATERIQQWTILNSGLGMFYTFPISNYFSLRPELSYGIFANFVTLEDEPKYFFDQMFQVSLAFKVTSDEAKEKGISIFASPTYTFSPEKKNTVHYFGFRAGITYEFN